jgi:hypothetical protein
MRDFRLRQADFSAEETTQALQVLRQRYLSLQTTTRFHSGLSASNTRGFGLLGAQRTGCKTRQIGTTGAKQIRN